jgi:ubiquitin C-terminal hydrolase
MDNWTLLGKDVATLVTLDLLRVIFLNGTLQVWIRRKVHRAWRKRQRRLAVTQSASAPVGLIFARKSGLIPPTHDLTIRGIPNYGQTCFLNSVLQALTSLQPFLTYLERIVQLQHQQPSRECFSNVLWNLLQGLQHESLPRIDAREILARIGQHHQQFKSRHGGLVGKEQQDAQELLQALLDMVITDARLSKGSSLESSILSSDENEEFLSLSDFLVEMDKEQKTLLTFISEQNGHVNGGREELKVHDASKAYNGNHDSHSDLRLEEKKQEDFEDAREWRHANHANSLISPPFLTDGNETSEDATCNRDASERPLLSASTMLMLQTLSSVMPSPLSGWLGSTLQCCTCHHVRPIQNAPFLDIPIVPTSVSNFLSGSRGVQMPSSRLPACSLAQCLKEFTTVERVKDVECRNCTIRRDIAQLEEEVFMLQGAVTTLQSRKKIEQVEGLQHELAQQEFKLAILMNMDPDGCNDIQNLTASLDEMALGVGSRKTLERGYAKKCLLFTRCPNVLCLHVQRRYYDPVTNQMAKTMQHVDFPEVLDLSPYCAYGGGEKGMPSWAGRGSGSGMSGGEQSKGTLYRLMSVIEHCGSAFAGHYQTYRRVRTSDAERWVLISDQSITPIHWRDVRSSQAYMLFYESL